MGSLHFRHASVNTAVEQWPQNENNLLQPRSRTPVGHRRGQSLGSAEKQMHVQEVEVPLLAVEDKIIPEEKVERRVNAIIVGLWILSLIASSLCTYLLTRPPSIRSAFGSFSDGFVTDLRDARSAIHIKKQQFFGSLDFKDHQGFIPPNSPSLKYVGAGDDIDAAWEELTRDRYFLLSDIEARDAYGNQPQKYWNDHHGGYVAGLDMLHTLHCLNHLRMSLYPEHYPQDPRDGTMHKAHCIDHLRQLTMCNGDLTPVPTQFFEGLQRSYINSSRQHTCRDFSIMREWATERFNGSTAVKPRNRDGTPRENFYAPWY